MNTTKTLRRPANWQDFETLSKVLWGEIWKCPEIKKNGRGGQQQHGVDVYGIPAGESGYYGIQCKGKSEYKNQQFSEDEITNEIEKAKSFAPALLKLYFATTAEKDARIEEFVRKKNLEHKALNLFEVHLFSWEDMVDLIDENPRTNDYYVKNNGYRTNASVQLTFLDGTTEITAKVPFQKIITNRRQKIVPARGTNEAFRYSLGDVVRIIPPSFRILTYKKNHSFFKFRLALLNNGDAPMENFSINLRFEGEFQEIDVVDTNEGVEYPMAYLYDTEIDKLNRTGIIEPTKKILVSEEKITFDEIKIKSYHKETDVFIHWKFISKTHKDSGTLKLTLLPEIKQEYKEELVEDPLKVGVEYGKIEDIITEEGRKM